jgi:hypothetical protein
MKESLFNWEVLEGREKSQTRKIIMPSQNVFWAGFSLVLITAIISILIFTGLPFQKVGAYHLDGDNIWWSNEHGKIVVWPHTSYHAITHNQKANLTSFIAVPIQLDFAFEFEEPLADKNIWIKANISHGKWIYPEEEYTYTKISGNKTCEFWGCEEDYLAGRCNCTGTRRGQGVWDDDYYFDWKKITDLFTHTEYNGRHFYWIKKVTFMPQETKQIKWRYSQSIQTTGKWALWIKRTKDTIPEALANGMYIKLDPWWDSNFKQRVNISVEETGGVSRINEMADVWLNFTTNNCTKEYRIVWNDTLELTSQIYNETYVGNHCTGANALFMVNLTANQHKNYTLYFNNSGATAPSYTDLVKSFDTNYIMQVKTPIYNVTTSGTATTPNSSIAFINLSTSTLNGISFSVGFGYSQSAYNAFFNTTIKRDGVLMVESYPTNHYANATVRIYPYYSEIDFKINASNYARLDATTKHGLPSSYDYENGADYSFFGNTTYSETSGANHNRMWVNDEPITSGLNRTYIYAFFNVSQEGFIYVFENITSYFYMKEDSDNHHDEFGIGYVSGTYGKIIPTSYKTRFAMDRNFSSAGWQVARNERIKMENPLSYVVGALGGYAPAGAGGIEYNITDNNYESKVYETAVTNFNITVWVNYSILDFIDAGLIRNSILYTVDSNATNPDDNTTIYEKDVTIDLVETNATTHQFFWNLTLYYLNGSITNRASGTNNQGVDWAYVADSVSTDKGEVTVGDNLMINATVLKTQDNSITLVNLEFQQTNYTATQLSNILTQERWSKQVNVKSITQLNSTTSLVRFHLNLTFNHTTKARTSSQTQNITIYNIGIDDCQNWTTVAINFTNKDADTQEMMRNNIKGTFTVWKLNKSITKEFNFDAENVTTKGICIYPHWASYTTNAIIEYGNYSYVIRNYYLRNATLDNVTDRIDLYHLLDTRDTIFDILVQDESLTPISNAYIKAQRFYTENNTFVTTSMAKTDAEGKTVMKLVADEVDYKFIIEKDLLVIYVSEAMKLQSCTYQPCELEFNIKEDVDIFADVDTPSGVSYDLYFDNQSKIFYFTFSDTTGLTQTGRLNVTQKRLGREDELICDTSLSATSGTLTCNVSDYEGVFMATASIERSWRVLETLWAEVIQAAKILRTKTDSMVLGTFMILTFGAIGLFNPAVAIMLSVFAVIITSMLGLTALLYPAIISLIIVTIILIIHLRT